MILVRAVKLNFLNELREKRMGLLKKKTLMGMSRTCG